MKSRHFQKGVAAVELAFVLPLLLIITFIIVELGRAVMQYDMLAKSLRDAARYVSMQKPGTKQLQTRNLVVYGNTAGSGTPLVPGLTLDMVPDPTWQAAGALPQINTVTVKVSGFTFVPMMSGVFGLTMGPYTYGDIAVTMRSQL